MKNLSNYKYDESLSSLENLQAEHQQYEDVQKECQNTIIETTLKMAEVYIQAKIELENSGKSSSNQAVGDFFNKTEATVRNYIKIYNNKQLFETPVSNADLSLRNMLAVVDGKMYIDELGNLHQLENSKPTSKKKTSNKEIIELLQAEKKYLQGIVKKLKKELETLKSSSKSPISTSSLEMIQDSKEVA